jgi:hypothetical protein
MARLKEVIYSILQTDAQDVTPGRLGNLLGHDSEEPYGVYFSNPPEVPDFPLITFMEIGPGGGVTTIEMAFNISIWCNDYEPIQDRIFALLNRQSIGDADDIHPVAVTSDWEGPAVYDDDHKIYVKILRYMVQGVKL